MDVTNNPSVFEKDIAQLRSLMPAGVHVDVELVDLYASDEFPSPSRPLWRLRFESEIFTRHTCIFADQADQLTQLRTIVEVLRVLHTVQDA